MRRPSKNLAPALIAAFVGLTGCDAPSGAQADGEPIVLLAEDVHVLGSSESIAHVEDLQVLPDGEVWVLNSLEPLFVGFDREGNVLHEYGSRGGGPEEFRLPAGFVEGAGDGEAWVLDARRHALLRISEPDAPWTEMTLPRDAFPPGSLMSGRGFLSSRMAVARLGGEIVVPRSSGSMESGMFAFSSSIWGADLLAVDPTAASARPVVALGQVLGDPGEAFSSMAEPPPMLLWFRLWGVCSNRDVRVYDRLRHEVRRFGADGTEGVATPLPPSGVDTVTPDQFARAIFSLREAEVTGSVGRQLTRADSTRLLNDIIAEAPWEPDQLAAVLPRYVDLKCTDDGVVWMRPFDPEVGGLSGGPTWIRIGPDDGVQEVVLPERFDAYRFTTDRIWGVQRDELDVATVAWITIPPR